MQLETQIIPPTESPQVTAFDEKLAPLKERRRVLETQVSQLLTAVNPYSSLPTPTERAFVEARLSLPQAQADLQHTMLDIADLERERDDTMKGEQLKVAVEIDGRLGELLAEMRQLLEPVVSVNRKIRDFEMLQERLTGGATNPACWEELLPEADGNETRWSFWCREIRERFGV